MAQKITRRFALGAAAAAPAMTAPALGKVQRTGLHRGYADGLDGQIHYRIVSPAASSRLPLICLHASPLSGITYDNWLAEMGKDRIAVAPDTPGYGASDLPRTPPEIGDYAAAMRRFIDGMGYDAVDVMGYHTGGLIAAEMARRYPERIRKVVMMSAGIYTAQETVDYRKLLLGPVPTYGQMLSRTLDAWLMSGIGIYRDVSDERYQEISLARIQRYRTGQWGFRAAFNYDLAEVLPYIEQPILVLNPQDDLWEQTRRAASSLKNGRIHDLPGWTHGLLDAHTVPLASIVRNFLDKT